MVFDLTDIETYERAKKWVEELTQFVGDNVSIAIAANKCDLASKTDILPDLMKCFLLVTIP